jgi:hypothetical protein
MKAQYFVQGLFVLAGVVSFLAAILNWNWFFTSHNASMIVRTLGRGKARLIYGILGIILIGCAIFFFFQK